MGFHDINYWINFDKYSGTELFFNGIGCLFWVICYSTFVYQIIKKKRFVEMPWFIASGNLAWEFLWSFYVQPDTGMLYELSYKGAFFLDCIIFIDVLKYGHKQVKIKPLKDNFKLMAIITLISWLVVQFFFIKQGYDDSIGATSGYILNIIISILYPVLYFTINEPNKFSTTIAWSKWLGTGFITVSMFFIFPDNWMVQTLGVLCFALDLGYYIILRKKVKLEEA